MRLIDADALYEQIAKKEELARQRVLDTPSRMPNGDFNPSAMRYATQLNERTQMKFMITDAPTIEPEPHWIPCSERLPELDDEVLVTDDRGELRHCIFCTWGETWCGFVTYEEGMRIIATAWMPLPPVYRGDEK